MEVDWLICSQPWRTHEIDYYSSYLKIRGTSFSLRVQLTPKDKQEFMDHYGEKKKKGRLGAVGNNFLAKHLCNMLLNQTDFHQYLY